jgi:hypothetical protein
VTFFTRKQILGAPYLARFLRDMGYHRAQPSALPLNQQRTLRFVVSGFARSFSAWVRSHGKPGQVGEPGAPVHFLPLWFEWKSPEWRMQ